MGYKVLGYAAWRGVKWYLSRRYGGVPRKLLAASVVTAAVGGAVLAQRQAGARHRPDA